MSLLAFAAAQPPSSSQPPATTSQWLATSGVSALLGQHLKELRAPSSGPPLFLALQWSLGADALDTVAATSTMLHNPVVPPPPQQPPQPGPALVAHPPRGRGGAGVCVGQTGRVGGAATGAGSLAAAPPAAARRRLASNSRLYVDRGSSDGDSALQAVCKGVMGSWVVLAFLTYWLIRGMLWFGDNVLPLHVVFSVPLLLIGASANSCLPLNWGDFSVTYPHEITAHLLPPPFARVRSRYCRDEGAHAPQGDVRARAAAVPAGSIQWRARQ
jgi:hypothetical protein